MKRQRGRGRKPGGGGGGGGGGGNNHNHGNRSLESSGPDVKIRGTAAQIYEKYAQYARDAQSGGDRVRYETYLQHAEHYYRVMAASMPRERLLQQQEAGLQEQASADAEGNQHLQDGGMNGEQSSGGHNHNHNHMRSHNEPMNNNTHADDGDDDNDGDEGDEPEATSSSPAQNAAPQQQQPPQGEQDQDGEGEARRGRRRGRRRPADGDRATAGPAAPGGDTEARSALDSLARKQGALTGG